MANVSPVSTGVKWSVIITGATIVYTLLIYFLGMSNSSFQQYFSTIIFIAGIVLALRDYRTLNGSMTYGQGLSTGTLTGLLTGILFGLFYYVFLTYIAPEVIDEIMAMQEADIMQQGLDDEQLDAALEMTQSLRSPVAFSMLIVIGFTIGAFFVSLIASFFLKKDPLYA